MVQKSGICLMRLCLHPHKSISTGYFAKAQFGFIEFVLKYFIKKFLGFLLPVVNNSSQNIDNTDNIEICYHSSLL